MPSSPQDPVKPPTARPARLEQPLPWSDDPRSLQILSSEYASLSSARSLVYNEAFTRIGALLAFMSMSFVALALVSPATGLEATFLGIAAVVLTIDFVVGLMTLGRVLGTTADDLRTVHAMTRVRHAYLQLRPELRAYFTAGVNDDLAGVMQAYRSPSSGIGGVLYALTTSTGMVAVILALLGGTLAGVLALLMGAVGVAAAAIGIGGALLVFGAVAAGVARFFTRDQASLEVRFPSGPEASAGQD